MTAKQTKSRLARLINYLNKASKLSDTLKLHDHSGAEMGHHITVISSALQAQHDAITVNPVKKRSKTANASN